MGETFSEYLNLNWVYWTLTAVYVVTILSIVGVVISENRNPVKSLAWVTVLLVVPFFGIVLYILFGRSIKNKRFITKRNRRKLKRHESAKAFNPASHKLTEGSAQQIKLGQSLMSSPYYSGNSVELFNNGSDKFKALIKDIRQSRHYIYLQYYIFMDDAIGNQVAEALIKKAKEGVKVKVIYDHVGSIKTSNKFFKRMTDAGIEIYPFFKVHFPFLGSRINWRNHRKIVIIDGKVGYIGGMNIADRYIDGGKSYAYWRDAHLRVAGPILKSLNHSFATDWNLVGQPVPEEYSAEEITETADNIGMQMVTSGPNNQWSNIALMLLKAVGNANKRIYLQTPYFLPTEGLLRALQAAALSKIDVRIMMPAEPDSVLLRYASRSYIKECLQAGIKFYLYKKGMLHSKLMIVDDEFVTVGSANFDFRSFEHNFEGNLFIYSKDFNERLTEQFLADQADSERVLPYEWAHRPFWSKTKESIMRPLAPIL